MQTLTKISTAVTLCAVSLQVSALDITINNDSTAEAAFAFSYVDKDSGKWVVDGWYNVRAQSSGSLSVNSDNDVYYLYAELENGKAISDPQGIKLPIADGSFFYAQSDGLKQSTRNVSFVRASASQGKAQINIK